MKLTKDGLAYALGLGPDRFSEADLAENLRQIRDSERERFEDDLRDILRRKGCLNTQEICRTINRHPTSAVNVCSLTMKQKPFREHYSGPRCPRTAKLCQHSYSKVRTALLRLWNIKTTTQLFWDTNRIHKPHDLFRFFYLDDKQFKDRIGRQTLDGYSKTMNSLF